MSKLDSAGTPPSGASIRRSGSNSHPLRLDTGQCARPGRGYDMVADGSDNFETRYAVADACAAESRPLVHAAVGRFDGSVTVLKPYETGPDGHAEPVLPRSLSRTAAGRPGAVLRGSRYSSGALTGVIGTLQALEVIKLIVGIGEPLIGRLLLYDALAARFDTIRYKRS